MKYFCQQCNKPFFASRPNRKIPPRFCSRECRVRANDKIIKCIECGTDFRVPAGFKKAGSKRFCSLGCARKYTGRRLTEPTKKSVFTCRWCNKKFEDWAYRKTEFCSRQCLSEYAARQPKPNKRRPENKITKNCKTCGKEFTVHKSMNENGRTALYCSIPCKLASRSSGPETKCRKILEKFGVIFEHQRLIKPNFYVDFLIENRVVLQVDGEYWHGHPKRFPIPSVRQALQRARDKAQTAYLTACGYTVIRVWESDVTEENIYKLLFKS